jgi:chromosome transmission fidelity protein 18
LETPLNDLLRNIDTKSRLKRQQEEILAANEAANAHNDSNAATATTVDGALWVDRYAPKAFAELLSDEQVNRRALQWLKSWDVVVFPDKPGVAARAKPNSKSKAAKTPEIPLSDINVEADSVRETVPAATTATVDENNEDDQPQSRAAKAAAATAAAAAHEDDDRPYFKVLLLSGPPGVAKTTLAHILATHCGYEPHEINASDDRGAKQFSERLQDVVQASRTLSSNRPPLLILDEIDGSLGSDGRGAIGELLKVVRGYKSKNGFVSLRRPIICICNDKFAPPLRDLRPLCLQLDLESPRTARLVRRLSHVSLQQGLSCDDSVLSSLVESTRGDIRQSLTALQWAARAVLHRAGDGGLRRVRLQHLALADSSKDFTTSLFDAWRALATARSTTRAPTTAPVVDVLQQSGRAQLHVRTDFDELFDLLSSHSDDTRLLSGLHEQLLSWRYTDPTLDRTAVALDWLAFAVDTDSLVGETMSFGLRKYATCALLAVRQLCAVAMPPRLVYPVGESNLRQMRTRHANAAATFALEYVAAMAGLRAEDPSTHLLTTERVRASVLPSPAAAVGCVAIDMVSHLADILVPRIRSVNKQLLRAPELATLQRAASVHVALGLQYTAVRFNNADPQLNQLALDPPVTQLAVFNKQLDAHRSLSDEVIRMLQQEMFRERMRLKEIVGKLNAIEAGQLDADATAAAISEATTAAASKSVHYVSSYGKTMSALNANGASSEPRAAPKRDFFGRLVTPKENGDKSVRANEDEHKAQYPVVFTFHEGFTNAVRRPVFIQDFVRK